MAGLNCWEYKRCGRQPGGSTTDELGVCPASVCCEVHGIHGGVNAGRACWVVAGYRCGGNNTGVVVRKLNVRCLKCDFFNLVRIDEEKKEEGFSVTLLGMMSVLKKRFKPFPRMETWDIRSEMKQATVDIFGDQGRDFIKKLYAASMHRDALLRAITEIKEMAILSDDKRKAFIIDSRLREIVDKNFEREISESR